MWRVYHSVTGSCSTCCVPGKKAPHTPHPSHEWNITANDSREASLTHGTPLTQTHLHAHGPHTTNHHHNKRRRATFFFHGLDSRAFSQLWVRRRALEGAGEADEKTKNAQAERLVGFPCECDTGWGAGSVCVQPLAACRLQVPTRACMPAWLSTGSFSGIKTK